MRWRLLGAVVVAACGRLHFDANGGDATVTAASCRNAVQDGDETGIDCGGSCAPCVGATCTSNAACATGFCYSGLCELASGPPFWLPGPMLATARQAVGCATDPKGAVIVPGGFDGMVAVATTEVLAPWASAFAPGPDLNTARDGHAVATTSDGTVYAFGGNDATGTALMSLEALVAGAWSARTSTAGPHAEIGGAGGLDGKLYVVDNDGIWIYSPATDSWLGSAPPTVKRDTLAVARGPDGLIYAVGGRDATTFASVAAVDAWDPAHGQWMSHSPMHTERGAPAAVTAPDGRLYAISGTQLDTTDTPSVEAYAPERDRWIDVAALAAARSGACAAIAADGRLYVIGGYAGGATHTVEIYGPLVTLSPSTAAAGATVSVTGANFAADAGVAIELDGAPVASGTSDSNGGVAIDFVVPAAASGLHVVTAIDDRSQYPTLARLLVP